jgi:hypothetical protein
VAKLWQHELDFGARSAGGLDQWHAEQQRQREELARKIGLSLGKNVEVWLRGGVRLRGQLRLAAAVLLHNDATIENTRFEVSSVPFAYSEMESCVQIAEHHNG